MAARRPASTEASVTELVPRRVLLDTHVWLWWQKNDKRLGVRTRRLIAGSSEVRFSLASAWEMSIKEALGKLVLPRDANIALELAHSGFQELSIGLAHTEELRRLPMLHRDPFDRMLIAQSRVEGLTLVTVDAQLGAYDVQVHDATT
ncbi:MAG: PilT protein [Gemmatimonadetes bacterium]|nr:PilT protein [Gemmatimonadota bacterium]